MRFYTPGGVLASLVLYNLGLLWCLISISDSGFSQLPAKGVLH